MPAFVNTLTPVFRDFAVNLNEHALKDSSYKLPKFTKYRIVISRLYYSLFHRALDEFPSIRNDKLPRKHERILKELYKGAKAEHTKIYNALSILKDLRVWADYDHEDNNFNKLGNPQIDYYIALVSLLTK